METTTAYDVAAELRSRSRGLGNLKLHKLLYYVQGLHLAYFGVVAFDEAIEAWDNGPVVAELWRFETHGGDRPPEKPLRDSHLALVEHVLDRYGNMTGARLKDLTHDEKPWHDAYHSIGRNSEVSPDSMRSFFDRNSGDQSWFWTNEWIAGEDEADSDIKSGNMTTYDCAEDFIRSL